MNNSEFVFLLAADSLNIRLFKYYREDNKLIEFEHFTCDKTVLTDWREGAGFMGDPKGNLQKNDLEKCTINIAHQLFKFLHNKHNPLILIATKKFAGELKKHMHKEVKERLIFELDKDIVNLTTPEILSYIKKHI